MNKVFFGNTKTIFFKPLSVHDSFALNYQGPAHVTGLENFRWAEYLFFQDPETGFYKFVKFRMSTDRDYRDVYYTTYESAINAIREAYGLDSLSLDRLYNASLYTAGFILEQLQK
jgi:hypothetical protein